MQTRALGFVIASVLFLVACPSKDAQQKDAQTSSSGTTAGGPVGTGPLANLESTPFINEVWVDNEGGKQLPFIYFTQSNVRLSAGCRRPDGQLSCAAIQQLRQGQPIAVPHRELTGSISAGTKACMKANHKLVTAHNSVGAEDGFCVFPDGSMVSTGALEQYGMRILE